jgi:hypothetical protein
MHTARKLSLLITMLTLLAVPGQASAQEHPAQPQNQKITGVWRGQFDGLPGVSLVLTDENGSLQGAILFYFHQRKTVNDPLVSTPGLPEPIFSPRFDGNTLLFQVGHRRAHPPDSLSDPPVTIHLRLTGPNQAELFNEEDKGLVVSMVRTDY